MNKTAIKNYAVWARTALIEAVTQKAFEYEIKDGSDINDTIDSVGGRLLTKEEKEWRKKLIDEINHKNFNQVMEEAAYTWFNRFIALRYMEVNGFIPSRVRVFTNENGEFKPDILKEAMTVEIDGLNREKVLDLIEKQNNEELFKYLIITQCNALNKGLPYMFEKISNWTEFLFPANLLRADSIIGRMVNDIPEEDWRDAVQIIGWLYQYYNTELKDDTFAKLKKNIKITKERIPAATQLFTPDWIVRYMVENSLGKLWLEGHPDDSLKANWKYYLDEAEQEPEVEKKLQQIRLEYANIKPEDIKIIDPCMGSGHILVYVFDVLMQIYTASGYSERDAAKSILENNLYGLDIDDRAGQLAYFAVMMKARHYDRRIFSREITQNIYAISESNNISKDALDYFCNGDINLKINITKVIEQMHDAKEYGSILDVKDIDFAVLYARFDAIEEDIHIFKESALNELLPMVKCAEILSQKYDVVVTNPPYMGGSGMGNKLSEFVKKNYPDSKSDLFAVFIERCGKMTDVNRFQAMITQHAWMFLSSFEKLRTKLLQTDIVNMAHLGARSFEEIGGEVVQTTSFVMRKSHIAKYNGEYCRLIEPTTQQGKEDMFLNGENRYRTNQSNFSKIPGSPVAYWVSENFIQVFEKGKPLSYFANVPKGLSTGSVDRFMRFWYEANNKNINYKCTDCDDTEKVKEKWYPYAKGGEFRRWNGNLEYIVNWKNNGFEVKNFVDDKGKQRSRPQNTAYYFKKCMTYSAITSYKLSLRYINHCIFGGGGDSIHSINDKYFNYIFAFVNTELQTKILNVISPTMNFEVDHLKKLPIIVNEPKISNVNCLVEENVTISKNDWDSYETSWDFKKHPLV